MFLLQKKGLILVFVVLVVVSMDVQAAVDSCLYDCKVERINCVRDPNRCPDFQSCLKNCITPFIRCMEKCSEKRELLSKFFQDDGKEG